MTERCLQIRNLSCGYADRAVLEGLSAEVARGHVVGLLGANGSGKSTLLRTMAGLLPPIAGAVNFLDGALRDYSPRALARVRAYLPQAQPVETGWRAFEIVSMGRFPHSGGWPWRREQREQTVIEHAMRRAEVWELRSRRMEALSGGQRQRVHLARALAQQGRVLLLDEPTAHLDLNFQLAFYRLLQEVAHQDEVTVVVAVHDLNLAAQFCDQLWVLGAPHEHALPGLLAAGTPAQVLQPALLARAFGLSAQVRRDPVSGLPYVVPAGVARVGDHGGGGSVSQGVKHVHVMGGGGAAEAILRMLAEQGLGLSIGVVNLLDSDLAAAIQLGIETLVEAPFSPVGEEARAQLWQTLLRCDAVVVSEVPWGVGNIENLRALAARMEEDEAPRVLLLGCESLRARDFTQGEAVALYRTLLARGAQALETADEGLKVLMRALAE